MEIRNIITDKYGAKYRLDKRACNTLNKTLGTNFKGVYRLIKSYERQWTYPHICLDNEDIYIVREDGRLVSMNVSEWFSISLVEVD